MKKNLAVLITLGIIVVRNATGAPLYYSDTGNYYDAIFYPSGITWNDAKNVAAYLTYLGITGHLATVTSINENSFIVNNLGGPSLLNGFWLGGFQPPESSEPIENWQWITGEPWVFSNWWFVEPNNSYGGNGLIYQPEKIGWDEEVLQLWADNGTWNDIEQTSYWGGFIVEYETSNKTAPTPEPVSLTLFAVGIMGIAIARLGKR